MKKLEDIKSTDKKEKKKEGKKIERKSGDNSLFQATITSTTAAKNNPMQWAGAGVNIECSREASSPKGPHVPWNSKVR